jgi:hypothetical protein
MTVGILTETRKSTSPSAKRTDAGANNLSIYPGNGSAFWHAVRDVLAVPANTVEMRLATIDANKDGKRI